MSTVYTITAEVFGEDGQLPTTVRVSNVEALSLADVRPIALEALAQHMGSYNMADLGHGTYLNSIASVEYEVKPAPEGE